MRMDPAPLIAEVWRTIQVYEQLLQERAARTRKMIDDHGEVGAMSRLMLSPNLQKGFKVLRDAGRLNDTFEALIVGFPDHFSSDVVDVARWRLENADRLLNQEYEPS
jgi:hypothetical protein